jgi:hypothetical protein
MYRIRDCQFDCRYFGGDEGIKFKTKKEVLERLIDYHNNDFSGTDDKDNELDIKNYMKFWKIKGKEKLEWILEYGQWEVEKI